MSLNADGSKTAEKSLEQTKQAEIPTPDIGTEPRRGERERKPTEKGKSFLATKLNALMGKFDRVYAHWKVEAKNTKKGIVNDTELETLQDNVVALERHSKELNEIYNDYRKVEIPTHAFRRRIDKCNEVTSNLVRNAKILIEQTGETLIDWPEVSSVFDSSTTSSVLVSNKTFPQQAPLKDSKAAAEFDATKAFLKLMAEQEQQQRRLNQLEEEDLKNKRAMEEIKREQDRLEKQKRLYAAKANIPVYNENGEPLSAAESNVQDQPSSQEVAITPENETLKLVKVLSEAISSNRLPIPEPDIFSNDPLKYNLWKTSFQTLIERKNVPTVEKMYFLQRYIGGAAKEAVEGYFWMDTEDAYSSAWNVLDERFGDPFIIAKAYRDKLHNWPKIIQKDGVELRKFVDFLRSCESAIAHNRHLRILDDAMENQKLASKLPDWLIPGWNRSATTYQLQYGTFPNFSYFVTYLNLESSIACNPITSYSALKQLESDGRSKFRNQTANAKTFNTTTERQLITCHLCNITGHGLSNCRNFQAKPLADRIQFIQRERLCFGCLSPGHHSKGCRNKMTCDICQKRHPTCIHNDQPFEPRKEAHFNKDEGPSASVQTDSKISHSVSQDGAVNQTSSIVPVYVSTPENDGKEILVYAMLDTQSDCSFILEEVADQLNASAEPVKLKLSTMSSKGTIVPCKRLKQLQVRGFFSNTKITVPVMYTREFIPANRSHIPIPQTVKPWPHLKHLSPHIAPHQECEIALLIGYNCPRALMPREVVYGEGNQPFAQKTDLGWSVISYGDPGEFHGDDIGVSHRITVRQVMPEVSPMAEIKNEVHYVCKTQIKEMTAPDDIIRVLESDFIERTGEDTTVSQEDLKFLTKMQEEIKQKPDGHYEMPLPFKDERPNLPDNKACAVHRLSGLQRKFKKTQKYYEDYVNFMEDIISRGDAEKVTEEQLGTLPAWYIPHHGVYHPKKPNKIRVVFDCSARYKDTSLNDHLLTGPELTNSLVGVLCRFRKGPIAFMCDVERMFHQFHVKPVDQDYLRFLWWEKGDLDSPPSVFRMKVHLFGAASSPGCANFGLKHLASEGQGQFDLSTVKFIQRDFYVDDGLASVKTEAEAIKLIHSARELCRTGQLRLHKFVSNNKNVLASIPKEECAESSKNLSMDFGEPLMERALGVQWCLSSDSFEFKVTVQPSPLTRRGILSTVASIYDPLGFLSPFILLGKQILQRMCQEKLDWDDPLPDSLRTQWEAWLQDLKNLSTIKINRCYIPPDFTVAQYELHHFSDASVTGYGECSYLRAISTNGEIHCALVMGKARVAPTKVTTIPRLELSAAVISARISALLRNELEVDNLKEYFWTDSKVVLGYLNNDARRFHVFVANRIERIKSLTEVKQWHFVQSESNPADHASRGLTAEQLVTSNWFTGPDFLWERQLPEGETIVKEVMSDDPELRKAQVFNVQAKEKRTLLDRLQRFSDWTRAVKAIAFLKRCAQRVKGLPLKGEATSVEQRKEAEIFIIKLAQEESLRTELDRVKLHKSVKTKDKSNKLHALDPFIDDVGVLRVGGRLTRSSLHPHVKHPLILPKTSHISSLIIKHYHERVHHQGRGITVNELRSNGIWIIGCSSVVASHIHKCTRCRRYRRSTQEPKMADLPPERMETTPPFTYCGVDCFGPFYVKEARKELKKYGLLFTCLCCRAIHIEMIDDLTTDAFINALRTLIAIRGNVRQLKCDQGTNFVGAKREFMEAMQGLNEEELKEYGCEFVMNCPSSSHMGGVWERQILTVRNVLTAILDKSAQRLDSTSLRTFFYEIMAIVNSRPLTIEHLNDPTSLEPLTPNHILTMKSSIIMPPPGQFVSQDTYLRKRWRQVQFLANEFWTRWKKEYLLNLQQRQVWQKERRNTEVNDIVILKEENAPRNHWKMARVVEVHPSPDGRVRKVKLLLCDATLNDEGKRSTRPVYLDRPVHKIVLLLEANKGQN